MLPLRELDGDTTQQLHPGKLARIRSEVTVRPIRCRVCCSVLMYVSQVDVRTNPWLF